MTSNRSELNFFQEIYTSGVDVKTSLVVKKWRGDNVTGVLLTDLYEAYPTGQPYVYEGVFDEDAKDEDAEDKDKDEDVEMSERRQKLLEYLGEFYVYLLARDRTFLQALETNYEGVVPEFARRRKLAGNDFTGGYDYLLYLFDQASEQRDVFMTEENTSIPSSLRKYLKKKQPVPETLGTASLFSEEINIPGLGFGLNFLAKGRDKETVVEDDEDDEPTEAPPTMRGYQEKVNKITPGMPDSRLKAFPIKDDLQVSVKETPLQSLLTKYYLYLKGREEPTSPQLLSDSLKDKYDEVLGVRYNF